MIFTGVSEEEAKQSRVKSLELASLNNFSRIWAIGVVSTCLVPGPGMIKMKEYCLLTGWTHREGMALNWLVCLSKTCSS